jgi:hypothetical protein
LFGGNDGATLFDDTWSLDLTGRGALRWARARPAGAPPRPRSGHSACHDGECPQLRRRAPFARR